MNTDLSWEAVYGTSENTAALATKIADRIGAKERFSRERMDSSRRLALNWTRQSSADSDLTHKKTKVVIGIEEYRG